VVGDVDADAVKGGIPASNESTSSETTVGY
jgi:hypothetical protein